MKVIIITGDGIDNLIIISRKFNDPSLIDEYAKLFDFYLIDINNKIDIFSIKIIIGIMDIIMFGQLLLWKKIELKFLRKIVQQGHTIVKHNISLTLTFSSTNFSELFLGPWFR